MKINDGWIPVEEALPGLLETVLITFAGIEAGFIVTEAYINAGGWKSARSEWCYDNDKVIAWQPLPAPYQPAKHEIKPVWYQSIVMYEITEDGRVKESKLHQRVPDGEDAKRFAEMRLKHYMEKHSDKNVMARIIENLEYK